jgi:DeoR family fructose operon transcriptional repressor
MYGPERQRLIVEEARQVGRVEVTVLAARFDVTSETVRRDLTALERQGLLRRVHGGAIPVERLGFEPGLDARAAAQTDQKERIAKAALAELPTEGAILIDAGTTTGRLAEMLPADRELTVITNSLPIAMSLSGRPAITLLMIGGRIRGRTLATVDAWAQQALQDTFVDLAFVGTNGISVRRGLTTSDQAEAATKSAMIAAARRTVLLADHTKLGVDHLARFGTLADIDTFITDADADPELVADIEASGPTVVQA